MEVVGWGRTGGPSYERWDRKFLIIYWGRTFPPVIMKNVSQTSHYSYNFRLFSFQLKDIHKNNYSSISDYFLSILTTKRLSKNEKKLGVFHVHKRERERERERQRERQTERERERERKREREREIFICLPVE